MADHRPIRILSIDGGGIRGIIPALVLARLEAMAGEPVAKLFDLIAGTSTGGILALGLTCPEEPGSSRPKFKAADLVKLYKDNGRQIFSSSHWHHLTSLRGVLDERYSSAGVESVLEESFGVTNLSQSLVDVVVTAYEIEQREPFFFRTEYARKPPRPDETFDYPMWEVARATSAAPTYFEPHLLRGKRPGERYALVDGGVFANNPGMCAWADAKRRFGNRPVVVVSLGTGQLTRPYPYDRARDWGLAGWARPVLEIIFDGVSDVVDHQLSALLGK